MALDADRIRELEAALGALWDVLGPDVPPHGCCEGCQWERAEALQILRDVGADDGA